MCAGIKIKTETDPKTAASAADAGSGNVRLKRGERAVHGVVVSMPSSLRGLS